MTILIIGQLPKEAGGTYTTGIARVVENLYKKEFGGARTIWYFTNVPNRVARRIEHPMAIYNGYRMMPFRMIVNMICSPLQTIREWKSYIKYNINPLRFEFYKANFKYILNNTKLDLVHLHGDGLLPLFFANRKSKIPILLTFHGIMYNESDKNSWHFKEGYEETMRMAEYFTVLNDETKRKALALGMPNNKYTVIPNGVDTGRFYYSIEKREAIRKQMAVASNTIVFITTGVVIDRKGQYDFLQVLESLNIDYQYWIIGKGPDEQKIAEYSREKQIDGKIKLLGYIDGRELYMYLSAADIYAHVSTTEGQALSEIEAYATGLKVIVRKEIAATVIGDAFEDHDNYYIIDMDSYSTSGLQDWVTNRRSERSSRSNFDWSAIAEMYAKYYYSIIESL